MRAVRVPFVIVLAAVLGIIPAARAACDFACIAPAAAPQSAQGHCASHSDSQSPVPVAPVNDCGHNHDTPTLSLVREAAANLDVAPAAVALSPVRTFLAPAVTTRRLLTGATNGVSGSRAHLLLPLRI